MTVAAPLLEIEGLTAGYTRDADIIHDVHVHVREGEIVTVVGPNGAGKSTLLKTIIGLVRARTGSVRLRGKELVGLRPHQIARRALRYVPQIENLFPSLTVTENLELATHGVEKRELLRRIENVYQLFPPLYAARRQQGGLLSGGQRQMLAMARALVSEPEVLLLDEPSAGLSPEYTQLVFEKVLEIRDSGVSVLMVEQNARRALALSDRGYVLELGRNRLEGTGAELVKDETVIELYLGRSREVTR